MLRRQAFQQHSVVIMVQRASAADCRLSNNLHRGTRDISSSAPLWCVCAMWPVTACSFLATVARESANFAGTHCGVTGRALSWPLAFSSPKIFSRDVRVLWAHPSWRAAREELVALRGVTRGKRQGRPTGRARCATSLTQRSQLIRLPR